MTIRVVLQPQVYQSNLNNMIYGSSDAVLGRFKGIPRGKFTNLSGPVTQFTAQETAFSITTDSPGVQHTIRATLISNDTRSNVLKVRNRIVEKQFVPINTTTTEFIALLKGENLIEVFTENDSTFTSVISSHVGTFVTTYAREIFSNTQNPLDEQTRALFSDFSSRMTEILIPFQDLYADPKSLRTLISRFVTRSYMTKSGSTQGVRDFAAALLGTTPIFVPTQTDRTIFEPDVVPLFKSQLEFGGYEAHVWIPNFEIVHWLAFIRLINNARHFYQIQEIGEHEILVLANEFAERHLFDFDDPAATAYSEFTFTDFRIVVEILDKLLIRFCAAAYPFDLFITPDSPLGQKRLAFDSDLPFDSGDLLDAPALDPGADGWVGLSLTGRFEGFVSNTDPVLYALDSLFITPSPSSGLEDCVYDGYFTQIVSTFSSEQTLDIDVEAAGEVSNELFAVDLETHEIETNLMDFSDFANFTIGGITPGTISADTAIALAGTSSVKHTIVSPASNNFPTIDYTGPTQDWSDAGGQTVYLTIFIGPEAFGTDSNVEDIPNFPGSLAGVSIFVKDSLSRERGWRFDKEDLVEGVNVLPIFIDFPDAGVSDPGFDSSDITMFRLVPQAVEGSPGWSDLYFGRLYKLDASGTYRPARAKVELEDVDNVAPESLWGSELTFTDRFGGVQKLLADPSYNVDGDTIYIPGRYKIQRTAGEGFEGFNREETVENLRKEGGRFIEGLVKTSSYVNPGDERYVNFFTSQFSPTGDEMELSFTNPNPGPDLIDITGFSGGSVGSSEGLIGGLGSAMAQQFELAAPGTVSYLELHLHRIGDPVGGIAVSLHEDNGGKPGDLIERADGIQTRLIPSGVPKYTNFRLFTPVALAASTPYWIVVAGNSTYSLEAGPQDQVVWTKEAGGYLYPRSKTTEDLLPVAGSLWVTDAGEHHYFRVIGS
ncbi:hypothetical protein LCGC14_0407440 [marine sediment metagenome]|uniref:Uncharacterized protein n=1 Tax=marine sediment metagenome TaxID=412755 RepID=A0A0F9TD43_9ZZZZ